MKPVLQSPLFLRLWAVAILAHVVGDSRTGHLIPSVTLLGVVTVVLGLTAVIQILTPCNRYLGIVTPVLVLATVWLEAPFIGNHWLLAGFVAFIMLVGHFVPGRWVDDSARWSLLAFYSWAAFNKLNSGFFDPDASCGSFYADQMVGSWGLGGLPEAAWIAMSVIVATVAIELSVPVLLMVPATRRWGVVVGTVFHSAISLDLDQHFYDFTGVLIPLFVLFLASADRGRLEASIRVPRMVRLPGLVALVTLVVAAVGPSTTGMTLLREWGAFVVWIPWITYYVVRLVGTVVAGAEHASSIRPVLAGLIIPAIVFANGLTPYLELKTATSWNMYANLVTVDGESNHYLIRRTVPLTDVQADLVTVAGADDAGLRAYVGEPYELPRRNLLDYLSRTENVTVNISTESGTETLTSDDGVRLGVLTSKFALFRAVDTRTPPGCQAVWLPAR